MNTVYMDGYGLTKYGRSWLHKIGNPIYLSTTYHYSPTHNKSGVHILSLTTNELLDQKSPVLNVFI